MRQSNYTWLILLSLGSLCGPAFGGSSEGIAQKALQRDLSILKKGGDTQARIEIQKCYNTISGRSRITDLEFCYMLDLANNHIDESVRQNLGMTEDPTGFHNDNDLLSRVLKPVARMGIDDSNAKALLGEWTTAMAHVMSH